MTKQLTSADDHSGRADPIVVALHKELWYESRSVSVKSYGRQGNTYYHTNDDGYQAETNRLTLDPSTNRQT